MEWQSHLVRKIVAKTRLIIWSLSKEDVTFVRISPKAPYFVLRIPLINLRIPYRPWNPGDVTQDVGDCSCPKSNNPGLAMAECRDKVHGESAPQNERATNSFFVETGHKFCPVSLWQQCLTYWLIFPIRNTCPWWAKAFGIIWISIVRRSNHEEPRIPTDVYRLLCVSSQVRILAQASNCYGCYILGHSIASISSFLCLPWSPRSFSTVNSACPTTPSFIPLTLQSLKLHAPCRLGHTVRFGEPSLGSTRSGSIIASVILKEIPLN
jgi:hypothetical protein